MVKISYRDGLKANSKTYDKKGTLLTEFIYKNGEVNKVYEYYPNQKIKVYSNLISPPNHFYTVTYHENGVMASEGEGDFFGTQNTYLLKRGGWIFYNKNKEPYSILEFVHDGEREYLTRETIFDTIRKKTIKDEKHDPPLPLK